MSIQDGTTFYVYVYVYARLFYVLDSSRCGVWCVWWSVYVCAATGDRCMYVCACRCVTVCEAEESPVWLCPLPVCRLGIVWWTVVWSTDWSAFRAFRSGFTAAVSVGRTSGAFFASECRPILCELRAESPVS